jgi:hypothetical protein
MILIGKDKLFEVKYVPCNFSAPLNQVWEGYDNPYPGIPVCQVCEGSGYNIATKKLADEFYDLSGDGSRAWHNKITQDEVRALIDRGRLKFIGDKNGGWKRREESYIPTAKEINEFQSKSFTFSHDLINKNILVEVRAKRLGIFGLCPACKGKKELSHPDEKTLKLHNKWKAYDPPTGNCLQLWDFEGKPVSQVLASLEEIADWCYHQDNNNLIAVGKYIRKQL